MEPATGTREAWLMQGVSLLADHGVGALRIDRIAAQLGLSKGSFYHHFAGITGYRLDLLSYLEARSTSRFIDEVESHPLLEPRDKLALLRRLVLEHRGRGPDTEVALRAWAAQDDDARATQERIDTVRQAYLRSLLEQALGDREDAAGTAQIICLLLIGAQHIVPALSPAELGRVFDLTMSRVGGFA